MTALARDTVLDDETYVDEDLSGQSAAGARLLDCRFERCRADGLVLRRARLSGCAFLELQAVDLDVAESQWSDTTLEGARLGAVSAYGSALTRVSVTGGKLDYVNLRGATLSDVTFEDVVLGELDLSDATLTDVRLRGCRLDVLTASAGTRMERVDLTGAALHVVNGLDGLRGATVSGTQLFELAPLLAGHLGIVVVD